eukprot:3231950-Amphidinium_carterae.1
MDSSTTTVVTTSDDSKEPFYDCWSAVVQPAHMMPTQKKPKQKAKQKAKQVRFNAHALTHNAKTPYAIRLERSVLILPPHF